MPSFSIPGGGGGSKTRYYLSLVSGTSWTVPAGVTRINVLLVGGGGGGGGVDSGTSNIAAGNGGTTTFTGATSAPGGLGGQGVNFGGGGNFAVFAGANATANTGNGGNGGGIRSYGSTPGLGSIGRAENGQPGAQIASTIAVTPGAAITYAIGAAGIGNGGPTVRGGDGGSGRIDIEYYI